MYYFITLNIFIFFPGPQCQYGLKDSETFLLETEWRLSFTLPDNKEMIQFW